jgi:hypothetical protein
VDTTTWTTRVLDPAAATFQPARDGAILLGEGARGERSGLAAFGPDGAKRFDVLRHSDVGISAWGRCVYARTIRPRHRTYILDARTGRTVRTLRTAIVPRFL